LLQLTYRKKIKSTLRLTILAMQDPFKKKLAQSFARHYCGSITTNLHKLNV